MYQSNQYAENSKSASSDMTFPWNNGTRNYETSDIRGEFNDTSQLPLIKKIGTIESLFMSEVVSRKYDGTNPNNSFGTYNDNKLLSVLAEKNKEELLNIAVDTKIDFNYKDNFGNNILIILSKATNTD